MDADADADAFQGCLIGQAVGDALGFLIEGTRGKGLQISALRVYKQTAASDGCQIAI